VSTRWSIVLSVVAGVALYWLVAEGIIGPLIDLLLVVGGGFLIVRACLLRFGRAQPSRWGGYTALGVGLTGIGMVVFGMEQQLETFGFVAFLVGIWLETRAGLRRKVG